MRTGEQQAYVCVAKARRAEGATLQAIALLRTVAARTKQALWSAIG
jgi:hypothetical protein